ncbi:MAG TPA: 50S ribosomal protein L22 [Candidatus Saccharimonadales bacterium]|nr:50S ribosomal protein L22 [Candidatus Saccharimonadales bacterium]
MPAEAITRSVRMSPRKVSVVASLVRGRRVDDALAILEHTPRRSAGAVRKTLLSAKANAEHNHSYKPDSLIISEVTVTAGPRYRRYRAAARGRALRYERKTSHIKVVVDGDKRAAKKPTATPKTTEEKK